VHEPKDCHRELQTDTPEKIPLAVRHVRSFLLSHRTA
jgi:hypothetical protein